MNRAYDMVISIHAPRGGSDLPFVHKLLRDIQFQSTLPVGGATAAMARRSDRIGISIHAPRGGSDSQLDLIYWVCEDFNPRSPWGERPIRLTLYSRPFDFNPRSPWGERLPKYSGTGSISIFQSTLPVGGATGCISGMVRPIRISIHAPRGGSDLRGDFMSISDAKFQSTLPVGGATSIF